MLPLRRQRPIVSLPPRRLPPKPRRLKRLRRRPKQKKPRRKLPKKRRPLLLPRRLSRIALLP